MAAKPIERPFGDPAQEMASMIDLAILVQHRDGLKRDAAWELSWRAHGGGDEWQLSR